MDLTVTIKTRVTFRVEYFEPTEGGMATEQFGEDCDSLQKAVVVWATAKAQRPEKDWIVAGYVEQEVK